MYAKLKAVMKEAGYEVSEGLDFLAKDMEHFKVFARQVLGETTPHLNHLLAYPGAFQDTHAKIDEMADSAGVEAADPEYDSDPGSELGGHSQDLPEADASAAPTEPQAPAQDTPPADDSSMDVSAQGQEPKQDLTSSQAEQPTEQPTEQPQDSAEGAEQGAEGQGSEQSQEGAESANESTDSTEGEEPKE